MSETKTITQEEIRKFEKLKAKSKEFEDMKEDLKLRYRAGAKVQQGRRYMVFNKEFRTNVRWKACFIQECGEELANEISETSPKSECISIITGMV